MSIDALSDQAREVAAKFVAAFTALVELEKTDVRGAFAIAETFAQHVKAKFPTLGESERI